MIDAVLGNLNRMEWSSAQLADLVEEAIAVAEDFPYYEEMPQSDCRSTLGGYFLDTYGSSVAYALHLGSETHRTATRSRQSTFWFEYLCCDVNTDEELFMQFIHRTQAQVPNLPSITQTSYRRGLGTHRRSHEIFNARDTTMKSMRRRRRSILHQSQGTRLVG